MGAGRLLVADVDGTLLGDDDALESFATWLARRRDRYLLAYATGRHLRSLSPVIAATSLPEPDAVISAVGTEIHDPGGRPWPGWADRFDGWRADEVRAALSDFAWLDLQPPTAQTRLKASYDVRGFSDADRRFIGRRLAEAGLAACTVYSGGLHLDIIAPVAGKGEAAQFLAGSLGVAPTDVLVFGDSGNDLQMFQRGFRGTLVANALPELAEAVGCDVYRSPFPFARGVLDGIRHWSGG